MKKLRCWTNAQLRIFLIPALLILAFSFTPVHSSFAAGLKSEVDDLVTVKTITVLPVFDNVQGIYSRPVENNLIEYLRNSHRWEYVEGNSSNPVMTPENLEENEENRKLISASLNADAFVSASLVKGPNGIEIKMSLFLTKDQKLFASEISENFQRVDTAGVIAKSREVFDKLIAKIPYSGLVLSRQGTRVTVNLGKQDGLKENEDLTVIQVIKLKRHPKFDFIVGTEKQVVGTIKVLKVDETLSFGRISMELESNTIIPGSKISYGQPVTYQNTSTLSDSADGEASLAQKPDGKMNYGESPIEWLPKRNPTFGMVGARLGIAKFNENIKSSTESLESEAPFYPMIALDGELWLTPEWTMRVQMRQGIITHDNPASGTKPDEINRNLSAYELMFAYSLRLMNSFTGPKVEASFGYSSYRLSADKTTPASAVTTKQYGGLKFGLGGSYPLNPSSNMSLGANLNFVYNPVMHETPSTSGSEDSSVSNFGLYLEKKLSINIRARGQLDLELYSSDFSGGNADSSSQKHTTLSGGLYYMF